jgi:hypothetical protein
MAASFSGVSPEIIKVVASGLGKRSRLLKLLQDLASGGGVTPFVSGGGFDRFVSTINQLHSFAGGNKTQANVEQGLTSRPATPVGYDTASADEPMMSAAMPPPTGNPLSAIGQIMPLIKAGQASYDQTREQHDRAELIGQYRSCIDAGRGDCDRITAGLNPIALTIHTIHQPAGMSVTGIGAPAVAAAAPGAASPIAAATVERPSPPGIEAYLRNQLTPFADQAAAIRAARSSAPVTLHSILAGLGL